MIPVGLAAECIAIEPGPIEIVQTVEVLSYELAMRDLVMTRLTVSKLTLRRVRAIAASSCATPLSRSMAGQMSSVAVAQTASMTATGRYAASVAG